MTHTLDLPSLSTRPSYVSLQGLLTSLEIRPSTWTGDDAGKEESFNETKEINAWLPTIFRSDLRWFKDLSDVDGNTTSADDQREEIMDLAAKRLSERCGRSATSDITRTWIVPHSLMPGSSSDLHIQIHEPGLTEGNTGHKTWGTAFALIKQLAMLKEDGKFFGDLFDAGGFEFGQTESEKSAKCVLELGSGTGLLGIAAAAIWSCRVVLTDLEVVVPNMIRNMDHNLPAIRDRGGDLVAETLNWADHPDTFSSSVCPRTFPIILASDSIYDPEHVELLANSINKFLDLTTEARALVGVPLRDEFSKGLAAKLEVAMGERGFDVLDRAWVEARDDFGDGQGEVIIQRDLYGRRCVKLPVVEGN